MKPYSSHQPPTSAVVDELMRAGVSLTTALAMDGWKAQEVLGLLSPRASSQQSADGDKRDRHGRI